MIFSADNADDKILLTDIKVLILYRGLYTKARRLSPVLQMRCIGGSANCAYTPDFIECDNIGSSGGSVTVKVLLENIIEKKRNAAEWYKSILSAKEFRLWDGHYFHSIVLNKFRIIRVKSLHLDKKFIIVCTFNFIMTFLFVSFHTSKDHLTREKKNFITFYEWLLFLVAMHNTCNAN